MTKKKKPIPQIILSSSNPYTVTDLVHLVDYKGNRLETAPVITLCRCGASGNKPYCDGSHTSIGFTGDKEEGRVPDRMKSYGGKDITIHDNRGVCSHDGSCLRHSPAVFRKHERPWIRPDEASVEEIIKTIERCPSGALSYSIDETLHNSLPREPRIRVTRRGPLEVTGGIQLKDDTGSTPQCPEHYTLCRCGKSRNQPFCDGRHMDTLFVRNYPYE